MMEMNIKVNAGRLYAASMAYAIAVKSGMFKPILQITGTKIQRWYVREYAHKAKTEWPRIGPFTYALSKNRVIEAGVNPPTKFETLAARARRSPPLIDTGKTKASFMEPPYAIFNVTNTSVEVGSSNPTLVKHQTAHSTTLTYGPDEQARLAKNIPSKVGGKWNPLHFILDRALKKRSGRTYAVKARPMDSNLPKNIVEQLRASAMAVVRQTLQKYMDTRR